MSQSARASRMLSTSQNSAGTSGAPTSRSAALRRQGPHDSPALSRARRAPHLQYRGIRLYSPTSIPPAR
jgi:hypothetical protein